MMHSPSTDPSAAPSTRLLETGVELVRAEIAVAMARARQAVIRGVAALLATILAAALLQVGLVLCILAPLLMQSLPADRVWLAIALPSVLAAASLLAAGFAWTSLRRSLRKSASSAASPKSVAPEALRPAMLATAQEERVRQ